jgi:hypothetical protein
VILDPINDRQCLDQLTQIARELVPTTLIREVARRLGSREGVIRWFQSLAQEDDDGTEQVLTIQCDVPQRIRLLPTMPNCVERSTGALMLLEVIDPKTPRALATIDKPLRHTGLVEKHGANWRAVDLFPRRNATRNFDWGKFGGDVLQGVHSYVGKPLLSAYGLGSVADTLGDYENKAIGRDKPKDSEKKGSPPADGKQPQGAQPQQQPKPQPGAKQQQPRPQQSSASQQPKQQSKLIDFARGLIGGAGATSSQPTSGDRGGGKDGQETQEHHSGAAALDGSPAGGGAPQAGHGDRRDPHGADAGKEASGQWWFLGR